MEENQISNGTPKQKPKVTVKNVLRILTVLCIVFVFCPSFLVSCSDADVNVNVMTAVGGVKAYGETVVSPHPLMLVCLLLPVAALVLLFLKKLTEKMNSAIILGCTAVDLVIWFVFRNSVKKIAEENYCTFKTTAWFVFNVIAMLLVIILNAIILLGKMQMDTDLVTFFTEGEAKNVLEQMKNTVAKTAEKTAAPADTANASDSLQETATTNASAGGPVEAKPTKKIPAKLILVAAAAIVVLIAIIGVVGNASKTINLNKYITVEATGYDGYGTARVTVDWDAIEEKYGSKIAYTSAAKNEYGGFLSMMTATDVLRDYVEVSLDENSNLTNGQTINYTWDISEDLTKYLKCKVKCKDGSYTVSGLTEVGTFDAFADLQVEFSGVAPNGSANLNYTGSELNYYDFSVDKTNGLSNGDVITVSIDESRIPSYAQNLGMVPEVTEKQYTVSGLQSYLMQLSEIGEEDMAAMQQQASDVYNAAVAKDWSDDAHLERFTYVGDYLLTAKNPDTWNTMNYLYLVYKVQARNQYESYDKVTDMYWYIRYSDIMVGDDGKLSVDLTSYATTYNRFIVDSGISSGWFGTYCWRYYGYESLDALYKDVVTSYIDAYNHQDNIDESVAPEPVVEETVATAEGYIFPNSDTQLLTVADLEGLSAEQCKIARNEIYARHGRQFKDEDLQAYFDSCDWYEGTIAPDDFNESDLNDTEIANKDLIVKYEEKMGYR